MSTTKFEENQVSTLNASMIDLINFTIETEMQQKDEEDNKKEKS